MDSHEIVNRIMHQRRQRFPSKVPGLGANMSAACRVDGRQLRVAFASAAPGCAAQLVAGVLDHSVRRHLDVTWTVIPTLPGESELAAALRARAFLQEEGQRMMALAGPLVVAPTPQVTIAPIRGLQAMRSYEYGSRGAFFDDPQPAPDVVERRAHERLRELESGWCRYFAAQVAGRPVGGCYYTQYEIVPTIMGVYTIPAAQRQGVASALLAYVVGELLASGQHVSCLYVRHGNPAERLYAHLGFLPLFDEYTFSRASLDEHL
ncbi:MAG TPA: GNAT family N-acetyltransferase, partial [Ktedonobacterales bacterium]|nr:GNAT family N-acetyltransferase [Ktedonobacterales bacterium]